MRTKRIDSWRTIGFLVASMSLATAVAGEGGPSPRRVIRLDGAWQVAEGTMDAAPAAFPHVVPVPGLLDMADPPFEDVGKKSALRDAFWYRRAFAIDGPIPEAAVLKIHKARYGTKVFLNGELVGEHLPCFTPALIDARPQLLGEGRENVLVVRVGADREGLPAGMPTGWDFEKYLYIPGIYDSVELILSGVPSIPNVQVAPDIGARTARLAVEVEAGDSPATAEIRCRIVEASTGRPVGSASVSGVALAPRERKTVRIGVPLSSCTLWSPERPFLYRAEIGTGADAVSVRFGMRSFRFDPASRRALLNGETYYLRGTNVCAYRFFEDGARKDLPWRADWVRALHRKLKTMHWNSIRYCIGFPPELWYEIADEEGFLIQDEFPIWLLGEAPEKPTAEGIVPEYVEWMRERWNHPCVVIWDAQNESLTDETGKAIREVRALDLSDRPWENGWAEPQSATDCVEAHPYLFIRAWQEGEPFRLKELAKTPGRPGLNDRQRAFDVPIVINEYAWLWLNRDGSTTCLTDKVYESLLGAGSTVEERRLLYARYLAALTEFWRGHRECAGVLHFCGLGYSRPSAKPRPEGGATSDHFLDVEKLTFEPLFEEYVRDAFHPVGLMIDFWDEEAPAGGDLEIPVFLVNDLSRTWKGSVRLAVDRGEHRLSMAEEPCEVRAFERTVLRFAVRLPAEAGKCTIVAELRGIDGDPVRSLRDVTIRK